MLRWNCDHDVLILPTFYNQLLHTQIPKAQKIQSSCLYLFAFLGSVFVKAACKMLVKLIPWWRLKQEEETIHSEIQRKWNKWKKDRKRGIGRERNIKRKIDKKWWKTGRREDEKRANAFYQDKKISLQSDRLSIIFFLSETI